MIASIGGLRSIYVKMSVMPLIQQLTKGTDLDYLVKLWYVIKLI